MNLVHLSYITHLGLRIFNLRCCVRSLLKSRQTISNTLLIYRAKYRKQNDLYILNPCWMDVASGEKICLHNPPGDLRKMHFLWLCGSVYVQLA